MAVVVIVLVDAVVFADHTYFIAIPAAVTWPTSPHSDNRIAMNATAAPMRMRVSFALALRTSGLRQRLIATPMKLAAVSDATRRRGSAEMAAPTATATPILHMK